MKYFLDVGLQEAGLVEVPPRYQITWFMIDNLLGYWLKVGTRNFVVRLRAESVKPKTEAQ